MEIDKIFIGLVVVFGFLGGLALLSFSANAIKWHEKEMELIDLEEKRQEKMRLIREANRLAAQNEDEPIEVS